MNRIIVLLFLLVFSLTTLRAETLIRITNGEWEPYLSEYCYEYGLASHIVTEAFALEGIEVSWGFFPWARAYENAKQGALWDASAVWWPTEEVAKDFWVSVPVIQTSNVFFHLKSHSFDWETMDDLVGLTIGVTRGYDYGRDFMDALRQKKLTVSTVTTDEQNFEKLKAGRIQIFPNDPIVGYAQLRHRFSAQDLALFTHHPQEFEKTTGNLIISRKSKHGAELLEKFNSGMRTLRESGRVQQMYKDLDAGLYDKQKTKWIPWRRYSFDSNLQPQAQPMSKPDSSLVVHHE